MSEKAKKNAGRFGWFLAGAMAAGAPVVAADPGSVEVRHHVGPLTLTESEGEAVSMCFANAGAWDGQAGRVEKCWLYRVPHGFDAECSGKKSAPADELPAGAEVVE